MLFIVYPCTNSYRLAMCAPYQLKFLLILKTANEINLIVISTKQQPRSDSKKKKKTRD